jgi:cytochrome c biogenesis protein CcmG/thiol:disulfide interchange protein DsbE
VRLSQFTGKVVLLNFWATWCPPCRVEIPWFVEFQKKYGDRGLVVLGVSVDDDGWKSVRPFLEEMKVNYRMMLSTGPVADSYGGVDALPTTVMIDRDGRIASKHVRLVNKSDYVADIEALLK